MHSLSAEFLNGLNFNAPQLKTIRAIGDALGQQALWYQQVPETLKSLRQTAIIESSESSNRLEGVTVGPDRLKPPVEDRDDPRGRSEQEVAGYRADSTLYFIAETKGDGTGEAPPVDLLRPIEQLKIECGRRHFRNFEQVRFRVVNQVSNLLD